MSSLQVTLTTTQVTTATKKSSQQVFKDDADALEIRINNLQLLGFNLNIKAELEAIDTKIQELQGRVKNDGDQTKVTKLFLKYWGIRTPIEEARKKELESETKKQRETKEADEKFQALEKDWTASIFKEVEAGQKLRQEPVVVMTCRTEETTQKTKVIRGLLKVKLELTEQERKKNEEEMEKRRKQIDEFSDLLYARVLNRELNGRVKNPVQIKEISSSWFKLHEDINIKDDKGNLLYDEDEGISFEELDESTSHLHFLNKIEVIEKRSPEETKKRLKEKREKEILNQTKATEEITKLIFSNPMFLNIYNAVKKHLTVTDDNVDIHADILVKILRKLCKCNSKIANLIKNFEFEEFLPLVTSKSEYSEFGVSRKLQVGRRNFSECFIFEGHNLLGKALNEMRSELNRTEE